MYASLASLPSGPFLMIDPEKEIHDLIESEPDYRDDDESRGHRRALRDVTKIAASREQY